jgi:uncharacterized membrane protein
MITSKRFWEIDFLRGVAVIMMIIFHFMYDLDYFAIYRVDLWSGYWLVFERITACIFLLLVGVSLTLSYSKNTKASRFAKRGLKIFCLGLLITIITFFALPQEFIIFGVLHLIGIAVVLGYFFIRYVNKYIILVSGLVITAVGLFAANVTVDFQWLLWLGIHQNNLYTLDYFPLLPWFGIVLIGIFAGKLLYKNSQRAFNISEATNPLARFLCFVGRHSLLIYLFHQPVLIALLLLI